VLADNGWLTDKRTAAAACTAAQHLAASRGDDGLRVGVIGSGIQARMQLEMLCKLVAVKSVAIYGRTASRVDALVGVLAESGIAATRADTARDAVKDCDLVLTCTASTEPIVELDMLREGACLVCVGSDTPGKREVGASVIDGIAAAGGLLVCDSRENVERLGEMQWHKDKVRRCVTLGDVVTGKVKPEGGRTTLVDLTGLGCQDAAMANAVVAGLKKK
jgi:ornithine cyclodeaminase